MIYFTSILKSFKEVISLLNYPLKLCSTNDVIERCDVNACDSPIKC